jgi:hypothetical protein
MLCHLSHNPSPKIQLISDACKNLDEFPKHIESKKPDTRIYSAQFHYYEVTSGTG